MNQGSNKPSSQGGAFPQGQGQAPSPPQQVQQPVPQNAQVPASGASGSRSGAAANNDNEPLVIEEKVQIVNGEHIIKKYQRGNLLGKGGFAKCFQVTNLETKKIMAAKIIPKNTLVKNRARQKLISEIKIHKSLHNTNIVKFEHVFEDHDNVYILLELCPHQTLNELIKRRKRISELETLCYTVQIVQALKYLHQNRVIHRDLKLGNLFIGNKMEIKLGDFGLATKLEFEGEKKRTICGTPNYIAPEILDGRIGHSYEVDVWSLGVIIYTLLIGKPPFETQDVKTTYKRIKANQYSFPDHAPIPDSAKALIQLILQQDPAKRPTLDEILAHPFINNGGTIPKLLPESTLHTAPSSSYLKPYAPSATNLIANQQNQNLETFITSKPQALGTSQTSANLMKGVEYPNYYPPDNKKGSFVNPPTQPGQNKNQFMSSANLQTQKNAPTTNPYQTATDFQPTNNKIDNNRPQTSNSGIQSQQQPQVPNQDDRRQNGMSGTGVGRYQSAQQLPNINGAGVSRQDSQSLQQPLQPATGSQQENIGQVDGSRNSLWVTHYVDYSTKYGLGYLLSNGSSGVLFNDTTKIILDSKGIYFEYIHRVNNEDITEKHEMTNYPQTLQKKVTLLQHFRNYLLTEQARKVVGTNEAPTATGTAAANKKQESSYQQVPGQPLAYLKKWMQTKHAIMFRLSNKIVQVQFSDKTEILLNSQDKIVSFMNKKGERSHYPLADAMSSSNSDMTKRLRYTKEILTHLLTNNANANTNQRQRTGGEGANSGNPINVNLNYDPNVALDPTGNNNNNDNLKFGMTATMENDFPRLNSNNNNNLAGSDPFQESQLKGGISQKNLTDKDQMNILPQPKQTISQKALNTNFMNQGTNNPSNQIYTQQQQQQQQGFQKK